ncbi:MAG: hypothetical protein AAGU05_06195 [Anaerolineaceae bacterium]
MSLDPYVDKAVNHPPNPCYDKLPVIGIVNTILQARNDKRAMQLSPYPSRAFQKHEIHELIITPEMGAGPNATVNNVIYFCFFEMETSGVLWVGDTVEADGEVIGTVAGYDFTHLPNHMNIILKSDQFLKTGREAGVKLGSKIKFTFNPANK